MRVDLKKFLFFGAQAACHQFFAEAQKLGLIQFIDPTSKAKELPIDVENVVSAIKVLRGLPSVEQDELKDYTKADGITDKILQLNQQKLALEEKERLTQLEIVRVEGFGYFSRDEIKEIENQGKRVIQFYAAKEGIAERIDLPEEMIFINRNEGLDYFMAIQKEHTQYPGFSEVRIERTLGELKSDLDGIKNNYREINEQLKVLAKYNGYLHRALTDKLDRFNLKKSQSFASNPLDHHLFAVSGWVPVDKIAEIEKLAEVTNIHCEEIAIEPNETAPTYLENEGAGRLGEDLVDIYDTPSNTDKDPSTWVLFFFATFFAMIVGDAGYGLVFLLIAIYVRYKYGKLQGTGLRFWKLLVILSAACIIWGVLLSSFFGISLDTKNPLRKVSLINWLVEKKAEYHFNHKDEVYESYLKDFPLVKEAKTPYEFLHDAKIEKNGSVEYPMYFKFTDNILFEMALLVGVIHIILSLLRYLKRNWSAIGWVIFMIGTYLYLPSYLDATSIVHFAFGIPKAFGAQNGLYLIIGGFSLATVLALIQHKLKGLLEPMNVIQIFADTMSYLRIYALSLAGAMVAATINEFAAGTVFVVGALLFIIGHVTNIALSIMGGVIHGLRLNFIEWYHYSFEGGGKKFNPLTLLQKDKD